MVAIFGAVIEKDPNTGQMGGVMYPTGATGPDSWLPWFTDLAKQWNNGMTYEEVYARVLQNGGRLIAFKALQANVTITI